MADHFEPTLRTWIGDQLDRGEVGLREVRRHVAETYRLPLMIYYQGTGWHREAAGGGDWRPEDVIHDFLADRLGGDAFLQGWVESGLSLRRWLMNALHFYLKERWRAVKPSAGAAGLSWVEVDDDPGQEADRLMVAGMVQRAVKQTLQTLDEGGQAVHGRAFVAFYFEQQDVATVATTLGVTPGQVKGMLRLARGRFKASFYDLLARDGVPEHRWAQEVQAIMEVIGS